MGGGLEADLSQGAVQVLLSELPAACWVGWRPVLQVADVPDGTGLRPAPAEYQRYRLLLSDGVYSLHATLAPALDHLARGGALRRGSVVRLLRFSHVLDIHVRSILIFELKILQTECPLIGSLKFHEWTWNSGVSSTSKSMSHGLRSDCKPFFGLIQYGPSCGSYPSGGDKLSSVALSEKPPVWKVLQQIKDENLGYSDKPDLITVKAIISPINLRLISYVACPLVVNGKRCNAKATSLDGMWRCKNCKYGFCGPTECGWLVRIKIMDHTGIASVTVFEEAAEEIFGCRGRDLHSLQCKEQGYAQLHDIIMGAVRNQYVFQLKVEGWATEPAFSILPRLVECIVLKAEKVNPSAESHRLLGQIDTLQQEGSGSGLELHSPTMPAYTASLDSQVCSSVRRSSNSINSDCAISPQLRALMIQQQLHGCAVSEQQLGGCFVSADEP